MLDIRPLPPRAVWSVTTSSGDPGAVSSDEFTRVWRASDAEPWIIVDLGEEAELSGVEFHYDSGCSRYLRVEIASDGQQWHSVYQSSWFSEGKMDLAILASSRSRYWRFVFIEPDKEKGVELALLNLLTVEGTPKTANPNHRRALTGHGASIAGGEAIEVIFPTPRVIAGLWVIWGDGHATLAKVETSEDGKTWVESGQLLSSDGKADNFWWRVRTVRGIRFTVERASTPAGAQIRELRFRINNRGATPLGKLERAAAHRTLGIYPPQLRRWQTYWTVVGTPQDSEECLFNEVAAIEPAAKGPSFMPLLLIEGKLSGPLDGTNLTHSLFDGSLPIPKVRWDMSGMQVEVEAVAAFDRPVTAIRYRLTNTSDHLIAGKLLLTIWPHQVNPEWQHGGLSHLWTLSLENGSAIANDRLLFQTFPRPESVLVREFEGGCVVEGYVSDPASSAERQVGLLSGVMEFPFSLEPGATSNVEARVPMRPEATELDWKPFDRILAETAENWRAKLGTRRIRLSDVEMSNTLEAEVAYTLVNQNGPALQPGSRNYDRTWIRDGACHSFVLLQAGLTDVAQEYIRWYSQRVAENGLVPPILNPDGAVNTGYGSNIEFDAQGEFLFAVAETYKMSQDREFLAEVYPAVRRAMSFMVELSERTMRNHPPESRYHGLFPPSISHEGFPRPVHSYWDVAWGLRGWEDGAALAQEMGDAETASWARTEREKLRDRVYRSIQTVMREAGISYLPNCAENADFDPTSTSISFFPCNAMDSLPTEGLAETYGRYIERVRERYAPGWDGDFTPYELRNINAYTELGRFDEAHELMDYFMSCRRPAGWCFWAEVVNGDSRYASYIGDMPHTWIGAEIWIAVRRQLVKETDEGLVFLHGAKRDWLRGDGVRLTDLPTHYGPVNFVAKIFEDVLEIEAEKLPCSCQLSLPKGIREVRLNGQTVALDSNSASLRLSN